MEKKPLNIVGIVCAAICAVSIFVAVERYNHNAAKVEAMNQMHSSFPAGGMLAGGGNFSPGVPAISRYALVVAALAGVGGVVSLASRGRVASRR